MIDKKQGGVSPLISHKKQGGVSPLISPSGQEITEEGFTTCWNCGTAQGVTPEQAAASKVAQQQQYAKYLQCLRCDGHMQYLGIKKFHEGPITGGGVADFFQKREHYDTFACTRCGKLEFYLAGKGEDWRGPSQ